jgi:hypothetical protein
MTNFQGCTITQDFAILDHRRYSAHLALPSSPVFNMALPNIQKGSVDSAVRGVYRAAPVKLMIYGHGKQ